MSTFGKVSLSSTALLRGLFPNLWEPALNTRPRADFQAALLGALASMPQTLGYGLIIGNALGGAYSGVGIFAALFGSVLVGLVAVLFGGGPLLVAGPRASTMLVFAALIVQLKQSAAVAGQAQPTLLAFALACAAVAGAGLLQAIFAALQLGRLVRYVPLPVVAGFVNGSALLIILSQVWVATGVAAQKSVLDLSSHLAAVRPATLALTATTLTLLILLPRVIKRGPVMLWAVLLANALYHLLAAAGFGAALGGTLPPAPANFSLGYIGSSLATALDGGLDREVLALLLRAAVTMAILSSLDTLLTTSAVDGLTLRRSNGSRQLFAEGCANAVAGIFAMAPGAASLVRTQAALRAGMVSAAAPIGIALVTLLVSAGLSSALPLLSQAVMAGLLISLGIDLFDKWTLARLRGLFDRSGAPMAAFGDLVTVTVVVGTTLLVDLATAVAVGILVALVSFLLQMSRSPIRRHYRATALLSRLHGDLLRRTFIERHGKQIAIVELEGVLFFGSAAELDEGIDQLIAEGVDHIALDLRRVKDIDATGARVLERINQKLTARGGILALGYVDRERRIKALRLRFAKRRRKFQPRHIWVKLAFLGTIRAIGEGRFFADIDTAVAACESHLARTLPHSALPLPGSGRQPPALRGVDREMLRRLRPYLSCLSFAPGTLIFGQGGAPDAVYFLARGRVDVMLDLAGTERKLKVQSLSPGSVFGEMALIDPQPRSASIIAQQTSRCYCLSAEAHRRLQTEQSDIAFALLGNIAMIFAERLRATNNMLAEMEA